MGYFFDYECQNKADVIKGGGIVIENADGSVSLFANLGGDSLTSIPMTKSCCEVLDSSYNFNIDTQKCEWNAKVDGSSLDGCVIQPFKVVLNPKGNDGVIFSVDENADEDCTLDISFDYLMQFDCEDVITKLQQATSQTAGLTPKEIKEQYELQSQYEVCLEQLTRYENISSKLDGELKNTPYVIVCEGTTSGSAVTATGRDTPVYEPTEDPTQYTKLDVGYKNSPRSFDLENYGTTTKSYCLTEQGLQEWQIILGVNNYNNWVGSNGTDTSLYGCDEVNRLRELDNNTGNLLGTCDVSITARQELVSQIKEVQSTIRNLHCVEPVSPASAPCSTVSDMFETLNVCMTLDMVNPDTGRLETVYEESILNIGTGNLPSYLETFQPNTGLLSTGATGTTFCESVAKQLMTELGEALPNSGTTDIQNLVENSLDSEWLNFETSITDQTILDMIYNERIKISLYIKDCCVDFGILIDRIKLDRNCSKVDSSSTTISKSPSFDMIRVCDNKKSWLSNEEAKHREFDLRFRDTQYDINNYKLAINSKEVDLDINPANALEQDLFCYIKDNPCLLECAIPPSGFTGCTTCYEPPVSIEFVTDHDFSTILSSQTMTCDSLVTTACEVVSIWGLSIIIGCDTIYSGDFFTGTTILTAPTQVDYENGLESAATELDLTFSATSGIGTLTYTPLCDGENLYYNKSIKVDLTLDITTNCEGKQFQDNINFEFQDGDDFDFN